MLPILRYEDVDQITVRPNEGLVVPSGRKLVVQLIEVSPSTSGRFGGAMFRTNPSDTAFFRGWWVYGPGTHQAGQFDKPIVLHGCWVYSVERYDKNEVELKLGELESKYNTKLQEIEARHVDEIEAVKEAILNASRAALTDASISELTDYVGENIFEKFSAKFTSLIRDEVESFLDSRNSL